MPTFNHLHTTGILMPISSPPLPCLLHASHISVPLKWPSGQSAHFSLSHTHTPLSTALMACCCLAASGGWNPQRRYKCTESQTAVHWNKHNCANLLLTGCVVCHEHDHTLYVLINLLRDLVLPTILVRMADWSEPHLGQKLVPWGFLPLAVGAKNMITMSISHNLFDPEMFVQIQQVLWS